MMREVDLNEESLTENGPNSFFSKFNTIAFNRHNKLLGNSLNIVYEDDHSGSDSEERNVEMVNSHSKSVQSRTSRLSWVSWMTAEFKKE